MFKYLEVNIWSNKTYRFGHFNPTFSHVASMQRKRKRNMSYNEMYHLWKRMKLFFRILKLLTNLLIIERLIYNTDLLKNTNMNRNEIIFRYISFQINNFCFYLCTFYSDNKKNDNSRRRIRSVEVCFFSFNFRFLWYFNHCHFLLNLRNSQLIQSLFLNCFN